MKNFRYLLVSIFPLFLLLGCSPTSLSGDKARDVLDVILYNQADPSFSLPSKISLTIRRTFMDNFIYLDNPYYTRSSKSMNMSYDGDNHYFSLNFYDSEDSSNNLNLYYYLKGMVLYELKMDEVENIYTTNDELTYKEITDYVYNKAKEAGLFKLLLGEKEVNDLASMFYDSEINVNDYESSLIEGTNVDRYNFLFESENDTSLEAKSEIVTTYVEEEDDSELIYKTYNYHDITFENNIVKKDYYVTDFYYRYKLDDNVIRYEEKEESYYLFSGQNVSLFYPSLDDFDYVEKI